MLYLVTHWVPMATERGLSVKQEFTCGSLKTAKLWAKTAMPVAYETTYSARVGRFQSVDVQPIKRNRGKAHSAGKRVSVDQPIHYVPSCGDLGYW
jgi:hypothetical protein